MVVGHPWSVYRVRDVFFFYFEENKHAQLSSTPVIPVDDTKVPLIHACLNRFKGTLNGRGSKRTCFSMRCIIVGGDDAELIDHFNNDATYHRFTEVLGSWSFGDYFKEDAIRLLFDLLCQADYWITGETGPCGPCLGIFFDRSASQDGVGSVMNKTDSKFIEICRLVFVEFNRQADGVLEPLQNKHVLTGINVECLAAILQNKETHYELDVYDDVLTHISCYARREAGFYSGKIGDADTLGVDTAYRLLADHIRMIAVTNAPGSQLGNALLLGEKITLSLDIKKVSESHLIFLVQSYLLSQMQVIVILTPKRVYVRLSFLEYDVYEVHFSALVALSKPQKLHYLLFLVSLYTMAGW
ncbi:hypothetical protein ACQ4PT_043479 [Festuca glaucescens]